MIICIKKNYGLIIPRTGLLIYMDTTKQNRLVGKSYAHLARTSVNYSVAEATFQNEWSLLDGDGCIDAYYQYLTVLHLNFPGYHCFVGNIYVLILKENNKY